MVSPGRILFGLLMVACAGMASYFASTAYFKARPAQDSAFKATPAQNSNFHAIVERGGAVVLCLSNGEMLFPDRCTGAGRLLIVQPFDEGAFVERTASGIVSMENESPQNPSCALSRAKWDRMTEQTRSTGRKIRKIPPGAVAQQLIKVYGEEANLLPDDISAFGLDLDNDGTEEIIYAADNVPRIADLYEKTRKASAYFVQGGIFDGRSPARPSTFFSDLGDYRGGTDAIGRIELKGIVPIAAGSRQLAVLAKTATMDGAQTLAWLGGERLQRLATFEFRCH
ncbi:MAG TPA: hypothetical protein VFB68_00895 [Xanthobacteraceae bacterium]|nr:hypothetical protein [Xanthobacteraceae bacterium]